VDADTTALPDFRAAEKTFAIFYKFLKIGERGIVQTHLPESPFISSLARMNQENFYQEELKNRQKFNFPPFVRLIRLLYRGPIEPVGQEEANRVFSQIKSLISNSSFPVSVLGPNPAFIKKEKNMYRHQLILKFSGNLPEKIKTILKTLPRGWIVDVDPVDML
jgi:primosomal protein N' (replication factor Y)